MHSKVARVVLPISIDLHDRVAPVDACVSEAGARRPAAEIDGQSAHHRASLQCALPFRSPLPSSTMRTSTAELYCLSSRTVAPTAGLLIPCRNDHQNAGRTSWIHCVRLPKDGTDATPARNSRLWSYFLERHYAPEAVVPDQSRNLVGMLRRGVNGQWRHLAILDGGEEPCAIVCHQVVEGTGVTAVDGLDPSQKVRSDDVARNVPGPVHDGVGRALSSGHVCAIGKVRIDRVTELRTDRRLVDQVGHH